MNQDVAISLAFLSSAFILYLGDKDSQWRNAVCYLVSAGVWAYAIVRFWQGM